MQRSGVSASESQLQHNKFPGPRWGGRWRGAPRWGEDAGFPAQDPASVMTPRQRCGRTYRASAYPFDPLDPVSTMGLARPLPYIVYCMYPTCTRLVSNDVLHVALCSYEFCLNEVRECSVFKLSVNTNLMLSELVHAHASINTFTPYM